MWGTTLLQLLSVSQALLGVFSSRWFSGSSGYLEFRGAVWPHGCYALLTHEP